MKCVENKIFEENKEAIEALADDVKSVLFNLHHATILTYRANQYSPQSSFARKLILKLQNGTELEVELSVKGAI